MYRKTALALVATLLLAASAYAEGFLDELLPPQDSPANHSAAPGDAATEKSAAHPSPRHDTVAKTPSKPIRAESKPGAKLARATVKKRRGRRPDGISGKKPPAKAGRKKGHGRAIAKSATAKSVTKPRRSKAAVKARRRRSVPSQIVITNAGGGQLVVSLSAAGRPGGFGGIGRGPGRAHRPLHARGKKPDQPRAVSAGPKLLAERTTDEALSSENVAGEIEAPASLNFADDGIDNTAY